MGTYLATAHGMMGTSEDMTEAAKEAPSLIHVLAVDFEARSAVDKLLLTID